MATERVSIELPPNLDAPALARALVAEHGADLAPNLVADAILCVSEVVTNAVEHGRPVITLVLDTGRGGLGVEVTDHGAPLDPDALPPIDADTPHGRGLHIVAALSQAWGVRPGETDAHGPNKTVWFDLYPDSDGSPTATGPAMVST